MPTFVDRVGQIVAKGDRLTSYVRRSSEARVLGFDEQGNVVVEIANDPVLLRRTEMAFQKTGWIKTPHEITQFVDVKGNAIGVGDRIGMSGMRGEVIAERPTENVLEVSVWYSNPDAGRDRTLTSLSWAEILHAGWTKLDQPEFLWHHDKSVVLRVNVRDLRPKDFFILNDELYQVKSHNSAGWANCHNLNKATHPSVDWYTAVTPVKVRIETRNL